MGPLVPVWKVYYNHEFIASCKYALDAVIVSASRGVGATIRYGHDYIVWREGAESPCAAGSYDKTRSVIMARINQGRGPINKEGVL